MERTIYYVVELQLDTTNSYNGLRNITGYGITLFPDTTKKTALSMNSKLVKLFEIVAKTDSYGNNFYTDEEEIQRFLDEDEATSGINFNFVKL